MDQTVGQRVVGIAVNAAAIRRSGVVADFGAEDGRALNTQSGAAAGKAAVVLKAVVADDAVADEVRPVEGAAQTDV